MDHEMDKLTFVMLADWVDGRLPPDVAASVAISVQRADQSVHQTVTWLSEFVDMGDRFSIHCPPTDLKLRLEQHFCLWNASRTRQVKAAAARSPEDFEATVVFDSRRTTAVTAVRGSLANTGTAYVGYSCEVADIMVDITPRHDGSYSLEGRVLFHGELDGAGFIAAAHESTPGSCSAIGDETGGFTLNGVPVTTRHLAVDNGRVRIVAPLNLHSQPHD